MNCGIVGLPNVGKSTIFSALTSAPAEAANYPFCTISPNVGIVEVPDSRLDRIHELVEAEKRVPAVTEFVDIAGLVEGASRGEGLGNQFLANIREVGIVAHVVRCFDDQDVVHVNGRVDPVSDIQIIDTELALADLQSVERRREKNIRALKSSDPKLRVEAAAVNELLDRVAAVLEQGGSVRSMDLRLDDAERLKDLSLLTGKTQIYVCNVEEDDLDGASAHVGAVRDFAEREGAEVLVLSGKLEADIAALDSAGDRAEFLAASGIVESGLSRLIRSAYSALKLRTFYTAGGSENRAWTFREGWPAPRCAGAIHSDFERGFIKADVYHCGDLFDLGSEAALKSAGKLRMEGKDYIVRDGDVMHFRFNV